MSSYRVLLCYSTQSGTSESLGERFHKEFNELVGHEICKICQINNLESESLENFEIVIFFMSSYGEGEPCDDAIEFFSKLPDIKLNISYSLFGCGNSYYDDYQAAANKLNDELQAKGCKLIGSLGYGNEAENRIYEDFDDWKFDYINKLSEFLNIKLISNSQFNPVYQVIRSNGTNFIRPPFNELNPFVSNISLSSVKRYGSEYIHFNVGLDPTKSRLKYQIGDHIGIYPRNKRDDVIELMKILRIESEDSFKIVPFNRMDSNKWNNLMFPSYVEFFSNFVEINSILTRKLIQDLNKYYITSEYIKGKLDKLVGDKECFFENIVNRKVTFVKLFKQLNIQDNDFSAIDISFILENFGFLKPRYFSISSSEIKDRDNVGVMLKVVKDRINSFDGVCSKTIEDVISDNLDNEIRIFIKKSKFKLPFNISRPLIFICAGSGLAPFRGFLQDICSYADRIAKVGKITLYFGLRQDNDEYFIYKDEFLQFKQLLGGKLDIRLAVSGVTENKKYVQDLLREDSIVIKRLLQEETGCVYVCGSAILGQGVRRALVDVLSEDTAVQTGDHFLKQLTVLGRFKEDVW